MSRCRTRPSGSATRSARGRLQSETAASTPTCPPPTRTSPATATAPWSAAHYALDLDYDLAGNRLRGEAVIDAVAEEDLSRVVLDLAGLDVTKVTVDGAAAGEVRRPQQPAGAHAPSSRSPPARRSAWSLKYAGAPRPLIDKHHGDAGWEELDDGVIVAGQPHGAPTWFPCNDRPDDKASYSITVTAAADYTVVANGELAEQAARLVDRHLALRAGRADGHLPRDRPDRALRRAAAYAGAPVPMRTAAPGRRRRRGSRRPSAASPR